MIWLRFSELFVYCRAGFSKLWPGNLCHPAREEIYSMMKKIINSIYEKFIWFGRMQHIPKHYHYVRCPALELLCNSLCGPLTKSFGDPWCTGISSYQPTSAYSRLWRMGKMFAFTKSGKTKKIPVTISTSLWALWEQIFNGGKGFCTTSMSKFDHSYNIDIVYPVMLLMVKRWAYNQTWAKAQYTHTKPRKLSSDHVCHALVRRGTNQGQNARLGRGFVRIVTFTST